MDSEFDPEDVSEFQLVIRHNTVTGAFSCEGSSKNRLVSLGMLEYARQLINRQNMKQVMLDEMKNAPRIAGPGRFPQ